MDQGAWLYFVWALFGLGVYIAAMVRRQRQRPGQRPPREALVDGALLVAGATVAVMVPLTARPGSQPVEQNIVSGVVAILVLVTVVRWRSARSGERLSK